MSINRNNELISHEKELFLNEKSGETGESFQSASFDLMSDLSVFCNFPFYLKAGLYGSLKNCRDWNVLAGKYSY
jgi:hypothetical protein